MQASAANLMPCSSMKRSRNSLVHCLRTSSNSVFKLHAPMCVSGDLASYLTLPLCTRIVAWHESANAQCLCLSATVLPCPLHLCRAVWWMLRSLTYRTTKLSLCVEQEQARILKYTLPVAVYKPRTQRRSLTSRLAEVD